MMKAKTAKVPRIVKSHRLRQDAIKRLAELATKKKQAESEILEDLILKAK